MARRRSGEVRDAIVAYLRTKRGGAHTREIHAAVEKQLGGKVAPSSVRSFLRLNEGTTFKRIGRGQYRLRG